ncbi:MMPL family transporter [Streptomyces sp. LP05-1]|uniref:MMPL family transporter n=1 Tax=Streptomyces pyxinae TaxID=2970734 RepID=A0ABT2CBF8_9ACTN|nr:MMPL family transporter [Streptomyces sp. LP05-1]MCS0634751.1 MMPL family transporter [Streptomyces sp. LP05-1]
MLTGTPAAPTPPRRTGLARRLVPLVLVVVWLGLGAVFGSYTGKLKDVSTHDQAAFLPRGAESTRVIDAQRAFSREATLPAVVVWTREDGAGFSPGEVRAATEALRGLAGSDAVRGTPSPAVPSRDREALQGVVQLGPALGDRLPGALDGIASAARRVPGTEVRIAGPAAKQADLSGAFAGVDGVLLGVALAAVLLILLAVYRSVVLPFLIILSSLFALGVACAVVYVLADHGVVRVDGQVQGILSILVIGAATDYALLLTARFREEIARAGDRTEAARVALRNSAGAITASAATVALGLLALLLSDLSNNRALGPVGAIGIVCALASALTFLPAALALLGRAAFWPARPGTGGTDRVNGEDGEDGEDGEEDSAGRGVLWQRVAGLVDRRPRRVWALTAAALAVCAAFLPALNARGIPLDELFTGDAPSVAAERTLGRHFPGGEGQPAVIVADAARSAEVLRVAAGTDGVAQARPWTPGSRPDAPPREIGGRVRIDATLTDLPDSDRAERTVRELRERIRRDADPTALVGGYTAQQYDTQRTAEHDRSLIVPVVLAIVLVILIALLRALVLPVLLVGTVALSYAATLGVTGIVFQDLLGFSGTDASVPLYGFVFLVALGVDYNIFLMSRAREETLAHGTRQGMLTGLVSTGGVITSAGVVLAATFAALTVIPLAFLAQIAFIVAFGVLLDTVVVRSLLVPALVLDAGPAVWWPGRLRHDEAPGKAPGAASGKAPAPR